MDYLKDMVNINGKIKVYTKEISDKDSGTGLGFGNRNSSARVNSIKGIIYQIKNQDMESMFGINHNITKDNFLKINVMVSENSTKIINWFMKVHGRTERRIQKLNTKGNPFINNRLNLSKESK